MQAKNRFFLSFFVNILSKHRRLEYRRLLAARIADNFREIVIRANIHLMDEKTVKITVLIAFMLAKIPVDWYFERVFSLRWMEFSI